MQGYHPIQTLNLVGAHHSSLDNCYLKSLFKEELNNELKFAHKKVIPRRRMADHPHLLFHFLSSTPHPLLSRSFDDGLYCP
jgi:hypothetical protein